MKLVHSDNWRAAYQTLKSVLNSAEIKSLVSIDRAQWLMVILAVIMLIAGLNIIRDKHE